MKKVIAFLKGSAPVIFGLAGMFSFGSQYLARKTAEYRQEGYTAAVGRIVDAAVKSGVVEITSATGDVLRLRVETAKPESRP